jgi:murein DD-endopeptidase MepM/ murein hydrolase activator NlpD
MRGLLSVFLTLGLGLGLASAAIAATGDLGDEACLERDTDLPFSRALTASGIVTGSLADSLATTDVPAPAIRQALQALAFALDLNRDVRTGDRFHLRYEQVFTLDDEPTAGGRLLWAELKTAKTTVAVHRFRPHDGPESFWQPNGKAAAPSVLRAPLETMTLTSGFGLRSDPLDQPPGPLAGLANVAAPAPPPPPIAEPTPEEKAEVKREVKAIARAEAGLAFEGSLGSATDRFRNTDLDRIMAERRANARREKAEVERAAQEVAQQAEQAAAAKATAPPPVVPAAAPAPARLFMHEGLDLLANSGTPILAAADGTVVSAGPNGGYGNWIRLKHVGRLTTVYGHLSKFAPDLAPGTVVARGDVIGFVGNTGRSTGAHLHYELLVGATPVDPRTHAATRPGQLAGADLTRLTRQIALAQAERTLETAVLDVSLSAVSHLPTGDSCAPF